MKNILSSLTTSEKNRILEMHRRATSKFYLFESDIDGEIYWQSCDQEMNLLSDESKSGLKPAGNENGKELFYFEILPEDKAKNPQYDIQGCVGIEGKDSKVYIEEYDGKKVLRLYEGF